MSRRTIPVHPLTRRGALALTAGLLVAGLTACSDDGGDPAAGSPTTTSAAVAAKYADAKSLADALEAALAAGGTAKVVTTGTSNAGNKGTGTGTVRFGSQFGMDVTTGGTIPKIRVVAVGERVFARPAQKIEGKAWVRVDNANPKNKTAGLFGPVASAMMSSIDAHTAVDSVRRATSFEPLGAQDVEGTTFDAYRATLDKDAVIASLPEESRALAVKELFQASLVYTIHLDDQDRPRRVHVDSQMNGIPSNQVTDYTEWGVKATYQAPPADQVAILTEADELDLRPPDDEPGRELKDLSSPSDG